MILGQGDVSQCPTLYRVAYDEMTRD